MNTAVEILSDGQTVWVNDSNGYCIGRFGAMGIDVHHAYSENQNTECLHCTHGPVTAKDWFVFQSKMLTHHNVTVDNSHKPTRLR